MSGAAIVASYAFLGRCCSGRGWQASAGAIAATRSRPSSDYVQEGPGTILAGTTSRTTTSSSACSDGRRPPSSASRRSALATLAARSRSSRAWSSSRPGCTDAAGALSGILFLFLATVSPLLLDITRLARGYGLAFLAMSVLVVAALEASDPRGRRGRLVAFCRGGARRNVHAPPLRGRVRRDRRRPAPGTTRCAPGRGRIGVSLLAIARGTRRTSTTSSTSSRQRVRHPDRDRLDRHRADRPDARPGADAARRRVPATATTRRCSWRWRSPCSWHRARCCAGEVAP